jgi:hypothetical protein
VKRKSNVGPGGDSQLVELAGRNWLVSQLIQGGIEVARPERDHGVDLIAYIEARDFVACRIQVKVSTGSAFVVHREKYKGMLLVYVWQVKDSRPTIAFAMTSAEACGIAKKMRWTKNGSWKRNGYWRVRNVGADGKLQELLNLYRTTPRQWKRTIRKAVHRRIDTT